MNGYDVEAHVDFEIGRLKVEIKEALETVHPLRSTPDIYDMYERLVELYELRLAQFEQKEKDLRDIKDYYENNQPGY